MFSIETELLDLIRELEDRRIPYALCGALALAVYGFPRATLDIDLVAMNGSLDQIQACALPLGFTLRGVPMRSANGKIRIERRSKVLQESEDVLMLDILLLAPEIEAQMVVEKVVWRNMIIHIVSRESLARLKRLRGNAQDQADVERLFS